MHTSSQVISFFDQINYDRSGTSAGAGGWTPGPIGAIEWGTRDADSTGAPTAGLARLEAGHTVDRDGGAHRSIIWRGHLGVRDARVRGSAADWTSCRGRGGGCGLENEGYRE